MAPSFVLCCSNNVYFPTLGLIKAVYPYAKKKKKLRYLHNIKKTCVCILMMVHVNYIFISGTRNITVRSNVLYNSNKTSEAFPFNFLRI